MKIKILKSLYKRYKKYNGEIFLSRHEHKTFGLSEWAMRKEIRELRRKGLNIVGKRYCGQYNFSNLYKISDELLEFIKKELASLKQYFNIIKFNNETKSETVKKLLNLKGNGKNIVISKDKEYKYTYNTDYNIITRWSKTGLQNKWFNLFNGLKELFKLTTGELIKELGN